MTEDFTVILIEERINSVTGSKHRFFLLEAKEGKKLAIERGSSMVYAESIKFSTIEKGETL